MAGSANPDQTGNSLIWVYIVCLGLFVEFVT